MLSVSVSASVRLCVRDIMLKMALKEFLFLWHSKESRGVPGQTSKQAST